MLRGILRGIDARVRAIRRDHTDWPCAKGCDGCCRRLAEVPWITRAEWELLRDGIDALAASRRRDVLGAIAGLPGHAAPIVCPLLDPETGACSVYVQRPIACRSYGYYVQRGQGLYCKEIEARVCAGAWSDVVWGNHDALDQRQAALGERRSLHEWLHADGVGGERPN